MDPIAVEIKAFEAPPDLSGVTEPTHFSLREIQGFTGGAIVEPGVSHVVVTMKISKDVIADNYLLKATLKPIPTASFGGSSQAISVLLLNVTLRDPMTKTLVKGKEPAPPPQDQNPPRIRFSRRALSFANGLPTRHAGI
jgi:hypothetical protein